MWSTAYIIFLFGMLMQAAIIGARIKVKGATTAGEQFFNVVWIALIIGIIYFAPK